VTQSNPKALVDMGTHIWNDELPSMKTTIEIADDLLERAQHLAQKEKTTLRALTEHGLRLVLKEKEGKLAKWQWNPLVVRGKGLSREFQDSNWAELRDEIYRGRGA
jgi:hypothetical protein